MAVKADVVTLRVEQVRAWGEALCEALAGEIHRLGLEQKAVLAPVFDQARFSLQRDPASGDDSLQGDWFDEHGRRRGHMLFHADGVVWAEFDVIRLHPRDPRWFVEAVTAWGCRGQIKSEPRLLPVPG